MSTSQIYHDAIKALATAATGDGSLESPDGKALVDNPLCGDRVEMEVKVADSRVTAVAHRVRGCLLCCAVASVIGKHAPGATPAEIERVSAGVAEMLEKQAAPAGLCHSQRLREVLQFFHVTIGDVCGELRAAVTYRNGDHAVSRGIDV